METDNYVVGVLKIKEKRTNSTYFIEHSHWLSKRMNFCRLYGYDPIISVLNINFNHNDQKSDYFAQIFINKYVYNIKVM